MIVLQANHIEKQYDGHEVLLDANLQVQERDRVALVGANGAGKSTLLRIVMGQEAADSGDISVARGTSIGYVAQFVEADDNATVYGYVAETFAGIYDMERQLRTLEQQMADPSVYSDSSRFAAVTAEYDALREAFDEAQGYAVDARIRRVLDGLQFPTDMHSRVIHSLSGGQKTRLSLARLLAAQPDVLVLDEPTNYLDTETIVWLESYLSGYDGAILLVSHDRYFLDKLATVVYELADGRTTRYSGNYSAYVDAKAEELDAGLKQYEAQQKEIQRMETFIQKNIVRATTTKRAQSRRKMLERLTRLEKPAANTPKLALRFTAARESGRDVLRTEDLTIGYPGKTLAGPLDVYVARGQRVAILGPNGIGKTTFLNAIVDRQPPLHGRATWGQHVTIGFYDQEQQDLHRNKTVLQEIWDRYPSLDMTTVRTALGRFLFRGEDVEKPVATLSGGERSRLALCRLMLQQANVLVMDEPTNHLDLLAKEVLEDALQDFEGTLLFVSHDRYFMDALATHVWVFDEAGVTTYIGNYSDYVAKRQAMEKWEDSALEAPTGKDANTRRPSGGRNPAAGVRPAGAGATGAGTTGAEAVGVEGSQNGKDRAAQAGGTAPRAGAAAEASGNVAPPATSGETGHVRSADLRKLRDRVTKLEADIQRAEEQQTQLAAKLTEAAINQDIEATKTLTDELEAAQQEHAELLEAWEQAAEELEALEAKARNT